MRKSIGEDAIVFICKERYMGPRRHPAGALAAISGKRHFLPGCLHCVGGTFRPPQKTEGDFAPRLPLLSPKPTCAALAAARFDRSTTPAPCFPPCGRSQVLSFVNGG